jgi:transcriptional regulator with XRE-family HTH domain
VANRPAHELVTENLRRLTEAKGIPLTVVADRAGIDRRELFAMMAGEYDADLDWLNRLADALGVHVSEFLVDNKRDQH